MREREREIEIERGGGGEKKKKKKNQQRRGERDNQSQRETCSYCTRETVEMGKGEITSLCTERRKKKKIKKISLLHSDSRRHPRNVPLHFPMSCCQ